MTSRILVVLGICSLAASVNAAEVSGTFSAMMSGREAPLASGQDASNGALIDERVQKDYPLYGLANLQVDGIGIPGVEEAQAVFQGWGRLQLGDYKDLDGNTADIGLLYFQARKGGLHVRIGRQHLVQGVDRMEMIDGIDVAYHTDFGLSASAAAGYLTRAELKDSRADWATSARLAYRLGMPGEVGVSWEQKRLNGAIASQDVGVDAFYVIKDVRLVGYAAYAPEEQRLFEARLAASLPVTKTVLMTVDALRVAPDLLIPRTSIFSVFSDESHDAIGGDVQWDPSPYYSLGGEGHWLRTNDDSLGYTATLRATTYREPSHRSAVGLEGRRVDESKYSYTRGRAFTSLQVLPAFTVAVDAYAYKYDTKINNYDNAVIGQLSGIYDVLPNLRVAATISAGETPFAKSQVEGWLRLAWGLATDFAREWTP